LMFWLHQQKVLILFLFLFVFVELVLSKININKKIKMGAYVPIFLLTTSL
jgi:hypothetical protein